MRKFSDNNFAPPRNRDVELKFIYADRHYHHRERAMVSTLQQEYHFPSRRNDAHYFGADRDTPFQDKMKRTEVMGLAFGRCGD